MRGARTRLQPARGAVAPSRLEAAAAARALSCRRHSSSSSSSAATADGGGSGCDPRVLIKRQFLLQVHPDFFHTAQYSKERAINGENLKLLTSFLEPSHAHNPFNTPSPPSSSPRSLTFYLKPQPLPSRVTVPLAPDRAQVFTALRDILHAHCKGLILPALPPAPTAQPPRPHPTAPPQPGDYDTVDRHAFRYGDAWARARANARRRRPRGRPLWRGQEGDVEEDEEDDDDEEERPPPFLDLHLEAAARREGRWGTMQARRAAAAEVGRRVAALKARWGFEEVELRVDWAAEHLLVALQRLEEALDEYYAYGHGSSSSPSSLAFAGLELVVMQHDTALDAAEGRLLLCPSDPPLRWVAALADATPETLRRVRALRRREAALVRAVQNMALPGAVVERGLTCSRRQYRGFLRRCLLHSSPLSSPGPDARSLWDDDDEEEEEDESDGGSEEGWWAMEAEKGGSGLPSRPWEALRLRVERGVRPSVLESGALQVDAPRVRSHACLRALVERLAPAAQEAAARHHEASARLRELERWCLHPGSGLGLAAVMHEPAVAVAEATRCLERLLALPGDHPVRAALRGAAVGGRVVVGKAGYGWTREGLLRLPWDWDVARR